MLEGRTKQKKAIENEMKTTFYDSEGQKGDNLKSEYRCGVKIKPLQLQLQLYPSFTHPPMLRHQEDPPVLLLVTTTR